MKKSFLVILMMLAVVAGYSQGFEGTIRWSMNLNITDPATLKQMEEAKKKANDPATQAQMKEFEAKMNDPQFKKMLDQNPQMKVQIEAAMKALAGGDLSSMFPKGMVVKVKGGKALSSIEGGMMDKTDFLYLPEKDQSYTINHSAKTYELVAKKEATGTNENVKFTKTSETAKILNYTCTKYVVEVTTNDGKSQKLDYWATEEIKDLDTKAFEKMQSNIQYKFSFKDVKGYPLKIVAQLPQGDMTLQVQELKRESLPVSTFELPAGYTKK